MGVFPFLLPGQRRGRRCPVIICRGVVDRRSQVGGASSSVALILSSCTEYKGILVKETIQVYTVTDHLPLVDPIVIHSHAAPSSLLVWLGSFGSLPVAQGGSLEEVGVAALVHLQCYWAGRGEGGRGTVALAVSGCGQEGEEFGRGYGHEGEGG